MSFPDEPMRVCLSAKQGGQGANGREQWLGGKQGKAGPAQAVLSFRIDFIII